MQKKELACASTPVFDTYALAVCALLTALSVVLARLLTVIPSEVSRFSLEAVPILLAGLLFGALPGGAVGFSADLIGCLFSPYGYNQMCIRDRRETVPFPIRVLPLDLTDRNSFDVYATALAEEPVEVGLLMNCSGYGKFSAVPVS